MDKAALNKKSKAQLETMAKKIGANVKTPDGKVKTKTQLVNSIVMKNRLNGSKAKPGKKITMAENPKGRKPSIAMIKKNTKIKSPFYFDPATMRFFGQKLSDFTIYQSPSGRVYIYAPGYDRGGRKMGYSIREYIENGLKSDLESVKGVPLSVNSASELKSYLK
jgi:hypothetical protein